MSIELRKRRWREPHIIAAGLSIVAFSAFLLLAVELQRTQFERFDDEGARLVGRFRSKAADWFFAVITWAGSSLVLVPLSIAVLFRLRKHRPLVAPLVLAPATAIVTQNILKPLFDRVRPDGGILADLGPAFPSGHSTAAAAVWITLAWILSRERLLHGSSLALAIVIVLLVGMSRIYLDVHWTSDVLAGWTVGIAIASASIAVYERARAMTTP